MRSHSHDLQAIFLAPPRAILSCTPSTSSQASSELSCASSAHARYEDDAKKEKKGNLALVGAKVARKKSEAGAPGDELVVTSSFNDVLVLRGEGLDAWEKAITVEVAVGLS